MGTMNIIMGIVLTPIRHTGFLSWQEPHVQFLGGLRPQPLFEIVGNLVSIDKMDMHTLSHIARRNAIETMCIDEGITLDQSLSILESRGTK